MSTPDLKNIVINEWPLTARKDERFIHISFSNDRHHGISITPDMSPNEIGEAFMVLGENICADINLK